MPGQNRAASIIICLLFTFAPSQAPAQTTASSFDELRQTLKKGQTIVITGADGRRIKGKIGDLSASPPALLLLAPDGRTLGEDAISEIRATDGVLNGTLIGAGVGFGLAMWDYLVDPSEPDNAVIFSVAIGAGAAIGAGLDALIGRGKVLYRRRQRASRLTVAPLASRNRQGVVVSLRF
jgi:hypothetical protein